MARVLRYVTTDAMGSVTSVLSSTGEVLERRSYDAFGQMTCMLPDGTPVATSPTGLKVGFHGQLIDELTGMYQMGYRWYSPVLGRWVSRDPIGLEGGINCTVFADNAPNHYIDTFGMGAVVPPQTIWLDELGVTTRECERCEKLCKDFCPDLMGAWAVDKEIPPAIHELHPREPDQLGIKDLLKGEFHWWGFYGGPGYSNGGPDRDSALEANRVGPPYGPVPIDAQDNCYRKHDIDHKRCSCRSSNKFDVTMCKAVADLALSNCLWRSIGYRNELGSPKAIFSALFFRINAGKAAGVVWASNFFE